MMVNKNNSAEFPKGWISTTIGEIFDIQGGSQPAKKYFEYMLKKDYVRLLQIRDFGDKPVPTYVPENRVTKFCEKDDVLIARYGASLGRIVTGMEGAYNVALAKVIFNHDLINNKYVFYLLQTPIFQTPIHMISRSAQNGFNKGEIFPIKIPLPPFPEQHRIVAKIEELFTKLDAGIEVLKRIKTQLKRYRQAILKHAFEGKLTAKWRENNKDRKNVSFPNSWELKRLHDIGEIITGTTPKKSKQEYYGEDYPFFKPTDLNAGYYVKTSADNLSEIGIKHARLLPAKSILVTCIGATIGKTGFIRVEGASNQQINAIIPHNDILPKFVYFICISPQFQKSIINNASATTLPILNKNKFKSLLLLKPPLFEQQKIVEEIERRFSVADEIEKTVDLSIKHTERLRHSILKRAFAGKLVPQDPDDEPAEKLLERIKIKKTKHDKEKLPKKKWKRKMK